MLTFDTQEKIIAKLLKKPQNDLCADCNNKFPCWASLDFGVFICTNCSGAHRALGPSTTRVKSNKLDAWHNDWINNMSIGNSIINKYWEQNLGGYKKPTQQSSLEEIKKFIIEKYVKKKFAKTVGIDPITALKTGQKIVEMEEQISIEVKVELKPNQNKKNKNDALFEQFDMPAETKINKVQPLNKKVLPTKKKVQFDPFNTMKPPKPKPVETDLLDFVQPRNQTNKTSQKPSFDQFNFFQLNDKPHAPVSRKDQFNSFSGKNAKNSTTGHVTFDDLLQKKNNNHNSNFFNLPKQTANNLGMGMNFGTINPNQFATMQSNKLNLNTMNPQSSISFLDASTTVPQQITMNINMNMYPNVMNVNMINYSQPATSNNITLKTEKQITMQIKNHDKPKQQPKSWVDEWK